MSKIKKANSEYWYRTLNLGTIMDPDGWDRCRLEASWAELITKEEYILRFRKSTCMRMFPL